MGCKSPSSSMRKLKRRANINARGKSLSRSDLIPCAALGSTRWLKRAALRRWRPTARLRIDPSNTATLTAAKQRPSRRLCCFPLSITHLTPKSNLTK